MVMSAADLAAALDARLLGSNRWIARCLAHRDRTPSLTITERDGRVLLHCFAGCTQDAVIAALREHGLWSQCASRTYSPEERQIWRQAKRVKRDAGHFARAALALCETLFFTADYPDRIGLIDLARDLRQAPISTYMEFRERWPHLAAGLAHAGRRSEQRIQRRLAMWLIQEVSRAA
jgi:hypothetical protein